MPEQRNEGFYRMVEEARQKGDMGAVAHYERTPEERKAYRLLVQRTAKQAMKDGKMVSVGGRYIGHVLSVGPQQLVTIEPDGTRHYSDHKYTASVTIVEPERAAPAVAEMVGNFLTISQCQREEPDFIRVKDGVVYFSLAGTMYEMTPMVSSHKPEGA